MNGMASGTRRASINAWAVAIAGVTDTLNLNILIDVRRKPSFIVDTLIHEINHAIFFAMNCVDEDKEERLITSLSTGQACVMRHNPELWAWLLRTAKK